MSFLTRPRQPTPPETATEAAGTTETTGAAETTEATGAAPGRRARLGVVRAAAGRILTVVAAIVVFLALITPDQVTRLTPGSFVPAAFVRIPLEGLLGAALLLALPGRPRRVLATVAGALLGLLTIVKVVDMGFFAQLARPFDPVLDWSLLDDAMAFLTDSVGRAGAIGTAVAVVLLAGALMVGMTLAVRRLAEVLARHRTAAAGAVGAATAAWLACALLGVFFVPTVWVSADSAAVLAYETVRRVPAGLQDRETFAAEAAVDPFRDTAGSDLLTGLRGKDVVFSFVESYGRSALQNPEFAPQVGAVLDAGTRRLAAAGYTARSGFLTSPTAGGGSWLAHSTFLSGLWINNEQRYRSLVSSDRLALTGAFRRASWRTVGIEPGLSYAWPEGKFYGFDKIYDSHSLGYAGPRFSWATMPDQFTLSAFHKLEYATPDRGPLMAEITLISSHTPWAPVPQVIGWDDIGDGSVYGPMVAASDSPEKVWSDPTRIRAEYRRSVEYSLESLISFVEKYGDDRLVMVFLGDHEPAPLVTGNPASHDVPVTIVAHDPAVLDRISSWGWQAGLKPGPQAPVWPMNAFRDKFLTAFGTTPGQPSTSGAAGHR